MLLPLFRRYVPSIRVAITGLILGGGGTILINDDILEITHIQGSSMSPTLSPRYKETGKEDNVLWLKYDPAGNLRRGDVVLFMNPLRPDSLTVKRVIALGGDTVVLDPRRRPKVKEEKENSNDFATATGVARAWDAWEGRARVPEGHVWVEGDNHRESLDSNNYGPISRRLVTGKAIAVVGLGKARFWSDTGRREFWSRPWEDWKGKTKVVEGDVKTGEWTKAGLPVALADAGEHIPP